MKTTIEKAIEDINGYRSFNDKIDVRFVCNLLKTYLSEEKDQMLKMWQMGILSTESGNPSFDKYWEEKYTDKV
jgi:hypothetical protein